MTPAEFDNYVLPTYQRFPITIVRGEGSYIYDDKDQKYLDFLSGWSVSNLGHRPPAVVKAINNQVKQLIHVPNVFYTKPQGQLAKLLIENSIKGKIFFGNSGAEANEAAIKFAKLYGRSSQRHNIITAEGSFHGRTAGVMAATAQTKIKDGFDPHLAGFIHVPFNNVVALKAAIKYNPVAIMLEFVQGEGGINIATSEYAATVKQICQDQDILLIADEVQSGIGRTGPLFSYQNYDIKPDIITSAKALASGLPIGATIVSDKIASLVKAGMHGSTFGGGPLVAAAAVATLKQILDPAIRENVNNMSKLLSEKLNGLASRHSCIKEIRQQGLMIGLELDRPSKPITDECLNRGLYVNSTQNTVIRILPPLTTNAVEVNAAISILDDVLKNLSKL
ncbi:MAG TPA: aspartate aminotransferase family protein [Candidatus Saccharimonadales bacterium]|nr:aspartate aminotransferase family protein [Candidatus Saccharimonadales bacterium]